jgi:hypothetical protein
MIYNLQEYTLDVFPTETILVNLASTVYPDDTLPDRCALMREGTAPRNYYGLIRQSIQIITRDIDAPKARALAYLLYEELKDRFGLTLPVTNVDGEVFPALQTARIYADAAPQIIGFDDQGRAEFSTNYTIIWREY